MKIGNTFKRYYLIGLSVVSIGVYAQNNSQAQTVFINPDTQHSIDYWNIKTPNLEFHSSFKPYLLATLSEFKDSSVGFLHHPIKNFFLSKTIQEILGKVITICSLQQYRTVGIRGMLHICE